MNLKWHLISRIILIALLCLLVTVTYSLHRSNQQAKQEAWATTETIARQLEFQLLRNNAGFGQPGHFPDFELWQQTSRDSGVCARYLNQKGEQIRSVCLGDQALSQALPAIFVKLYRSLFQPDAEMAKPIIFNGLLYGTVYVAPSAEMAITHAWDSLAQLAGLTCVALLAVCALVYVAVSRALRPAHSIIAGLENMKRGDLSCRLPTFDIAEWQRTATAINQLISSQEQLLGERQQLAVQLMTVQEEERRYLARELHDELGQCLAGINAVATSIKQTAALRCPEIVAEADQVTRINQRIMGTLRNLLNRLRPADIDELGLGASLANLVSDWNGRCGPHCRYSFTQSGDCTVLPEPWALALYRAAQECLTNIAKHASATRVNVTLTMSAQALSLVIEDNGVAEHLPLSSAGMGLLGIRERITALGGQFMLDLAKPNGLIVRCCLPTVPTLVVSA